MGKTRGRGAVAVLGMGLGLVLTLGACGGSDDGAPRSQEGAGGTAANGDGNGNGKGAGTGTAGRTVVTFAPEAGQASDSAALERTAELMRDRAAVAGLEDVEVTVEDEGQITVAGPGDRRESLESLGRPAELGFRPVLSQEMVAKGDTAGESACSAAVDAKPSEPTTACGEWQGTLSTYRLEPVALPGTDVADAEAAIDEERGTGWYVKLEFTSTGAKRFADITGRLAQQPSPANQFAIVLDGTVLSAPYVASAITGGEAEISGTFTRREAEELAAQLTTGALPVRLKVSSVTRLPGS